MKKIMLAFMLLLILTSCTFRTNDLSESSNKENSFETEKSTSQKELSEEESEVHLKFNEKTEKYYDYFIKNNHVSMLLGNETGGEGFSDAEMAAYAISELILENNDEYDQGVGFTKEKIDSITEKYFGTIIKNYENRASTVVSETGNITSTGWGSSQVAFVLKELEIGSDGISTATFYRLNFGMDDYTENTKSNLMQGLFDDYEQPFLEVIVFEEKTNEKNAMYLRYYEVKSEGRANPPYEPYQG